MKIKMPNLPQEKVSLFAAAGGYPELIQALQGLGAQVIEVKKDSVFEENESDHPDMHIHHLGDNKVMLYRQDKYLADALISKGFEIVCAAAQKQGKYPKAAALNALRIGNLLLCNQKAVDENLRLFAQNNGIEIVPCRQGYSRCASCVVSENAVITADPSVYKALNGRVDVLVISQGQIKLGSRYDGMIGGCSSMLDKNTLGFFGNLNLHSDCDKIKGFLKNHSVAAVILGKNELTDVGTFIPLETK